MKVTIQLEMEGNPTDCHTQLSRLANLVRQNEVRVNGPETVYVPSVKTPSPEPEPVDMEMSSEAAPVPRDVFDAAVASGQQPLPKYLRDEQTTNGAGESSNLSAVRHMKEQAKAALAAAHNMDAVKVNPLGPFTREDGEYVAAYIQGCDPRMNFASVISNAVNHRLARTDMAKRMRNDLLRDIEDRELDIIYSNSAFCVHQEERNALRRAIDAMLRRRRGAA